MRKERDQATYLVMNGDVDGIAKAILREQVIGEVRGLERLERLVNGAIQKEQETLEEGNGTTNTDSADAADAAAVAAELG
jgi:hypothetical protein